MTAEIQETADAEASVTRLVSRCMEQLSAGHAGVIDEICREHADLAPAIRARLERLRALGMLDGEQSQAPRRVGPFEIVGKLGQGGMGEVHLGRQSEPVTRLAAVKVIRDVGDAQAMLRRFEHERRLLAALSHPGIAQVLEAGADEQGRPWFAMEYVDGQPLSTWCDGHRLSLRDRIELFLQVCDAVTHAHMSGIVHRDLKPSNVLVSDATGRPLVKVIDFGLAKATEGSNFDLSQVTDTGHLLGTPVSMSPEQAGAVPGAIDARSDVYALGVMLHQLLVGCLPFRPVDGQGHPVLQMQQLLREARLPRPSSRVQQADRDAAEVRGESSSTWRRALTGDIDWILDRALRRDPAERYQAVPDLAADLRRHLRDEPVSVGPPSLGYRAARFLKRHRREALPTGVVLLALVAASIVYVVQLSRQLSASDVLSAELRLTELLREAEQDLWPRTPDRVPAMRVWHEEARGLVGHRAEFAEVLERLEDRSLPGPGGLREFDDPRDQALHVAVVALLGKLEALDSDRGALADVTARIAWAQDLERLTLVEPAGLWEQALAEIADPARSPAYEGLRLEPQLGLIPLGRDPHSGLWEFAAIQPGAALPSEHPGGGWTIGPETCPVLVLIPGGPFVQGAQDQDPDAPGWFPSPAPEELGASRDPISMAPFFLSKYELTRAQLARAAGLRDAHLYLRSSAVKSSEAVEPAVDVSWNDARHLLGRMSLLIPTGAQFEYAARAGHPSPWWCGSDEPPLERVGNVADATYLRTKGPNSDAPGIEQDYDDGWASFAPVGSLRPNPFGLHDVIGNAWEWCRDPALKYDRTTPRADDGYRTKYPEDAEPPDVTREVRGGSCKSSFTKSRSTYRLGHPPGSVHPLFGVRPSRPIYPPRVTLP